MNNYAPESTFSGDIFCRSRPPYIDNPAPEMYHYIIVVKR